MSEKRRDNKKRVLRTGETQRKDGRYRYKYTDSSGKEQTVYSWKLFSTDKVPEGKRSCLSLREKEALIQRNIADGIDTSAAKITLCQLYARQNLSRSNVKRGTEANRKHLMEILKKDELGTRSIISITSSDAKEWAVRMKNNGYSFQTINNHKRSLKASFYIAIQEGSLRKNPFDFKLSDVVKDDTIPRQPLSENEEEMLLSFAKDDPVYCRYYEAIFLLLKTGMRISELCGLTVHDLDFCDRMIHVDHQLLRNKEIGYYIDSPKTKSSIRLIPMSEEVYHTLKTAVSKRENAQAILIDGYSDFVFLNQHGLPMTGAFYTSVLRQLVKKYNKTHDEKLPNISPHLLRHTFCTRLAEKNMNPKCLQYIMGHSDISITLNLYAHASISKVKQEINRLIQ